MFQQRGNWYDVQKSARMADWFIHRFGSTDDGKSNDVTFTCAWLKSTAVTKFILFNNSQMSA